ncbi:hypothetical protein ACFX13_024490 [Malus domestica]
MTATVVSTVLNHENYADWSFRMKTYFLAKDLWDIVEGTVEEPPEGEEHKAWKKKDAKALYAIQNSCGDDIYPLIKDKTTAEKAWDTLSWRLRYESPDEGRYENAHKPLGEAYPNKAESALEGGPSVTRGAGHDESIQETFVKYVKSDDWDNAINFLRQHPQAASARVSSNGTALHYAIKKSCSVRIIQELVELMAMEHLEIQNWIGFTAFHCLIILSPEMVEVAECMVKKNPDLLLKSAIALVVVAQGHTKGERMARYLYSLTRPETIKVIDAAQLIFDGFRLHRFDIAWDLIQRYPKLAINTDHNGNIPLAALASNRFAFKSGRPLHLWEKLIYHGIRIKPLPTINTDSRINVDQGPHAEQKENKRHHLIYSGMSLFRRLVANLQTLLGINRIYQIKLVHERVQQFLPLMCKAVSGDMNVYKEKKLKEALCVATERGHVEYITNFFGHSSYPVLDVRNKQNQSLFQIAAECRHYNVYNIICEFLQKQDKDSLDKSEYGHSDKLKKAMEYKDNLGNNMLHTVARITPVSQIDHIQGATLQMQRELQWFKEVESIVDPMDRESNNNDKKTPREVFTENHKEMWKDAKKSMKETANSCTIVGALIITIMFAAVFTVPGGYDGGTGLPIFLSKKVFITFMVSDALSLFSSTTSVIMFLGVITSRYHEDEFHGSLPTKMIIGLFTLFSSIASMMIVFSCALYIMLDGKSWIVIPTILLASVPLTSYLWMQFPLLVESFLLLDWEPSNLKFLIF